jgi:nitrite transporter NirC
MVIFARGVLANWIVCLAVRIALRCHEEIAKIVVLLLVVFIFLYLGGEHSIANMGTFTIALMGHSPITPGDAVYNLLFATAGNIVGGVLLIGLPFAYINPPGVSEAGDQGNVPEAWLQTAGGNDAGRYVKVVPGNSATLP